MMDVQRTKNLFWKKQNLSRIKRVLSLQYKLSSPADRLLNSRPKACLPVYFRQKIWSRKPVSRDWPIACFRRHVSETSEQDLISSIIAFNFCLCKIVILPNKLRFLESKFVFIAISLILINSDFGEKWVFNWNKRLKFNSIYFIYQKTTKTTEKRAAKTGKAKMAVKTEEEKAEDLLLPGHAIKGKNSQN